jgi:hypothetical protein
MLVEGACVEGHDLVCVIQQGRVSGVLCRGALRETCPTCGGKVYVQLESGTVAVTAKLPSDRPPPALTGETRRGSAS